MVRHFRKKGFTLIEVVVALTILAWVLGSALFLVSQYADERLMMRERFYSNQVAWNQLMNNFQRTRGWAPINQSGRAENEGVESQAGQDWYWQTDIAPAMGKDLFRYQVRASSDIGAAGSPTISSALSMYLLIPQSEEQ